MKFEIATVEFGEYSGNLTVSFDSCKQAVQYLLKLRKEQPGQEYYIDVVES